MAGLEPRADDSPTRALPVISIETFWDRAMRTQPPSPGIAARVRVRRRPK